MEFKNKQGEIPKTDALLEMAIQQGYTPKECQLPGGLVMALVNSGKNPCDGCNVNNCKKSEKRNC